MRDDELDRMLFTEQGIVPSESFARTVMAKVRMEAAAPPPIAFPWKRALPGVVLCVLALAAMCVAAFLRPWPQRVQEVPGPSIWTGLWSNLSGILRAANVGGLGWILLALLLTYASVKLSLRLSLRVPGRKI